MPWLSAHPDRRRHLVLVPSPSTTWSDDDGPTEPVFVFVTERPVLTVVPCP